MINYLCITLTVRNDSSNNQIKMRTVVFCFAYNVFRLGGKRRESVTMCVLWVVAT